MITVLVADDDPFVRRGIADILNATPDIRVVADVDDGDKVAQAVSRFRPHAILMDLNMRRMGGLEATRQVMQMPRPAKVIAMTAMDVDDLVVQAISAGAHSFLNKDASPESFYLSVRAVVSDNTLFSADALRRIVQSSPPVAAAAPSTLTNLSSREREILCAIASGATNAEISAQLYLSETTVKTHISSVFGKLGARNRVEAALVAFRAGLIA
ncbi:response regulator transcription factor [Antrihabitans stalactiti]|uniref:Response regulator transcription factor n=1 Tax=Antrihabitans stalactiti TaxID=2584121 RepID=A0A848KJ31_9NOCA|nr:response regulator transcription factor [Antrihabitans stalactiti]NMN97818.1 response regulator transcription factor [Antrihabitans stalactiti]